MMYASVRNTPADAYVFAHFKNRGAGRISDIKRITKNETAARFECRGGKFTVRYGRLSEKNYNVL